MYQFWFFVCTLQLKTNYHIANREWEYLDPDHET